MKIKKYSIFNRIEDIKDIFQEISDIGYYVKTYVKRSEHGSDAKINVIISFDDPNSPTMYRGKFFDLDIMIDDIRRLLDYSQTFAEHYDVKVIMNPIMAQKKFDIEKVTVVGEYSGLWFDITKFINKDHFYDLNVKVSSISITLHNLS